MGNEEVYIPNDTTESIRRTIADLKAFESPKCDPRIKSIVLTKLQEAELFSLLLISLDRTVKIIINTKEYEVNGPFVSYKYIVLLAGLDPDLIYSVTYTRGSQNKPDGILSNKSLSIPVKEGMIFNISDTSRA